MRVTERDRAALEEIDFRLRILLPEEYQDAELTEPVPMRAAGLKFDADGRVAWNEIWGNFCDLAMAGGPPHKGTLLAPAAPAEVATALPQYQTVLAEIVRGVHLVTGLHVYPAPGAGWVRVDTHSEEMAGWLLRAITMENVAVRAHGIALDLPVSPSFRLEKEIKNVVTVIAKTVHYWTGHMPAAQHGAIADLFATLARTEPLVTAASGWRAVPCDNVRQAIWLMRALVAHNILARREACLLWIPEAGDRVNRMLATVEHLAGVKA